VCTLKFVSEESLNTHIHTKHPYVINLGEEGKEVNIQVPEEVPAEINEIFVNSWRNVQQSKSLVVVEKRAFESTEITNQLFDEIKNIEKVNFLFTGSLLDV
jgi:hypothetical protein